MKIIIPHEYIVDGDGKDVRIDPKEITAILWQEPYAVIKYRPQTAIVMDLQVFEICALVADALYETTSDTLILTEKDA